MRPIRVILHPTDFSAHSEGALELARSIARNHGARLVILHTAPYEMTPDGMPAPAANPAEYVDALNELRDRVVGTSPGFPVETCLREGSPAEEILRAADDLGADLIVMGSHGRTGLMRLLVGSVAEAVMRRAGCPVLLSKSPADTSPDADTVRAEPAHGVESPAPDRVIVAEGRCGCGVRSAHVVHRDFPEYWAEGDTPAEGASRLEAKLAQAREGCCRGDWHDNDLSRAIRDVQAFRTAPPPAAESVGAGVNAAD